MAAAAAAAAAAGSAAGPRLVAVVNAGAPKLVGGAGAAGARERLFSGALTMTPDGRVIENKRSTEIRARHIVPRGR